MTVGELIEALNKFDPNMEVMRWVEDNDYPGYNAEILSVTQEPQRHANWLYPPPANVPNPTIISLS